MNKNDSVRQSKFLSLVLRHKPETIGLILDSNGWANTNELIEKIKIDLNDLQFIVDTNDKKRFSFNEDKTKIRANQGHSLGYINLELTEKIPPDVLYHGTASKFFENISKVGINKQKRQFVHLSKDIDTATKVGQRHGKPIILKINSEQMYKDGFKFYLSENKVWLTDFVPTKYFALVT